MLLIQTFTPTMTVWDCSVNEASFGMTGSQRGAGLVTAKGARKEIPEQYPEEVGYNRGHAKKVVSTLNTDDNGNSPIKY